MRCDPPRSRAVRGRALAAALLAATLQGAAAPGGEGTPGAPLDLDVVLGFSDTFRPGRWTPLTVTVRNRGPALAGRLEVHTRDGDEFRRKLYPVVHHRPLELGPDASKRFHFTVFLESVARPLAVQVLSGERVVARRTLDLRRRFTAERLLLVLSRDADLDYLNDRAGKGLRVLYPHPQLLPERWQGYDAVAAVVLHGLSLESLDARQHEALLRWIARGGTLAVSGGPDYALLRTPRLAALLPATPAGMLPAPDPQAVGRALGAPLQAPRGFHLNRVERVRGEVLHDAGGVPLVLEARRGRGRVLYLTFDVARYPFDRWSPMKEAWQRILDPARRAPAPLHQRDEASMAPALLRARAPDFPGHGTLLVFMGLYLSLLWTGYRLRAIGRRRWLTVATWAVPVAFAPAAYLLFGPVLFERGAAATLVSVIEPLADSSHAALRLDLALHANRRQRLMLAYEGADPVFRVPAEARARASGGWRFGSGGGATLAPADASPYRLYLLEGHDTVLFPLGAQVRRARDRPQLEVRNASGRILEGAWLVHRGAAWYLGTIAAEAAFEHDLGRTPDVVASERDEWWEALARDPRAAARNLAVAAPLLARRADARDDRRYPGAGHALLLAFTASPLRLRGASEQWRRTDLSLVLFRFPARFAPPGAAPEDADHETT